MQIQHEAVQTMPRLPFKYYEHDPQTTIDVAPHWHQGIELNYLVAGATLKFVTDGQTVAYQPGDIWATNRRSVHSATGDPTADWDEFGLIIDDDYLLSQLPASAHWQLTLNQPATTTQQPASYQRIRQHLQAIHDLLHRGVSDNVRLLVLSHFFQLLVELDQHFATTQPQTTVNPNQSLTDQIMTTINDHYAEPISGSTLAAQYHVSLTTLNQQFNANLQLSVNRYLRLVRLMHARRLLLATDMKVDYIAMQCGFTTAKTLNRNFKAWKGLTPTDYRQAYQRDHQIDTSCL
ncbi:AraC family transcriptional regulator [Lactiplantibacillus daowaiensis]|uniref:Helix-turn-helix domain-containing protein n=1 Tax=Lactiplantibacillus daowaiensis TaxID=2559918 RepID=A0ABW1S3Y8_9LACO|nr:AraC family transcriptional regulator [Lactiplantibacillus daowaiensis]